MKYTGIGGRRFTWTLVLVALVAAAPLRAQSWDDALDAFGEQIEADVVADDVGGVVAGVMVDGDLVWARAFGWADRDARVPMSTASVSRTGSISKSVTAVLMMRLVDQGVIELDDPVERYLPEFADISDRRPGAEAVTFRHLASHTAGLIREPSWSGSVVGPLDSWGDRILESIPQTAYDSVPGARYQYSNIGFGIAGLALERATGRPFMDMVRTEVFEPLGMTGSEFVVDGAELDARLATGYVVSQNGAIDAEQPAREHDGRGYKVPNGGVYSTVADLGRFMGAMSGVPGLRILSEKSRRDALTVQTPESPTQGYGLGFSISVDQDGRTIAGHGGSVAGYTANMAFDPDARIGVVLLRNYGRGATNLGRAAQDLVAQLRDLQR
jgi:CubicO group peptidase (beta-lactamase class C family)